jgi:hypothetical protein
LCGSIFAKPQPPQPLPGSLETEQCNALESGLSWIPTPLSALATS